MEVASGRAENSEEKEVSDVHHFELETSVSSDPMSALEILRECVRILRYDSSALLSIVAVLICPVSAVYLSNVLVNQSLVKWLDLRLLLLAKTSGLSLGQFIHQSSEKFSEIVVSIAMCLFLFMTLLLLSKTAVAYSVDSAYSRKTFDHSVFYMIVSKIWKRILFTYLLVCGVISSCFVLFIVVLVMASSLFLIMGCPSGYVIYLVFIVGALLAIFLAYAMVICNIAVVISVLEDVSAPLALRKSSCLVGRRKQVGLFMFLGSTLGLAFVEGLFEHRVTTLSYGDGSSRIWEGPLLVVMYSFVLLIESMMNTVFYFSCKSCTMESTDPEAQPILEAE